MHTYLNKVSIFPIPRNNQLMDFAFHTELFLLVGWGYVPFRKTGLALAVLKQKESDLQRGTSE